MKKFQFVGGQLCLDFANTVGGTRAGAAREYLHSYADFLCWCREAGLVSASGAGAMRQKATRRSTDAAGVFQRALALREAIYRIFSSLAWQGAPDEADLEPLNEELCKAHVRLRVVSRKRGFGWEWAQGDAALDGPLGPIARSAADLLTSRELLARVRQCAGDGCDWLFMDSTRNHSRRWCVMSDCGNRAKVRRHRQRRRRVARSE